MSGCGACSVLNVTMVPVGHGPLRRCAALQAANVGTTRHHEASNCSNVGRSVLVVCGLLSVAGEHARSI